ncbi:hypothetical protein BC835DRAFT_1420614 [Cytidiella melzeri]|nr:hypothetical protein BC835DRAFT_1420614 [Cytidiella melzeri]
MQFLTTLVILATSATGISHVTTVSAIPFGNTGSRGHELTASHMLARQRTDAGNLFQIRGLTGSRQRLGLKDSEFYQEFIAECWSFNMDDATYRKQMENIWTMMGTLEEHNLDNDQYKMFQMAKILKKLPTNSEIRKAMADGGFPRYTIEGGLKIIHRDGRITFPEAETA